ncbi:MAG TPA: YjfB family protein [Polyangiaceae bacterium]|nr:YjfB family protein [Polyangiaceae bacterium]
MRRRPKPERTVSERPAPVAFGLKGWLEVPFKTRMNITAPTLNTDTQYQVAVAKKIQSSTDQLNQSALQLIDNAAPTPAPSGNVGTRLNIRA